MTMAYDPTIPNQSNLVRTASGDLALMQGNFNDLAPLVSGTVTSGTAPSAAIRGFYFGDPTNRRRFFLQSDGSDILRVMRNISGEAAPSWQEVLSLSQVSGEDILLAMKASGQTPTDAAHLATKGYVDTVPTLSGLADTAVSGAISGQIPEWDGSNWVNMNHAHELNDLTDVAVSPASGDVLLYDGAQWGADALVLTTTLASLTDTAISSPTSGQTLTFDGSDWVNTAGPAGNRVICVLSGAQVQDIPGSTVTTFSGDEVPFNQGGFTVASGTITIPDGIARVDVTAQVNWASSAGNDLAIEIMVNGLALSGLANYNLSARDYKRKTIAGAALSQNVVANDVPVSSGDTVTMALYQLATNLDAVGGTGLLVREATNGGSAGGGGVSTLSGLTDTAVSGATSGQVLTSDGAGVWSAEDAAGGGYTFLLETELTVSAVEMIVSGIPATADHLIVQTLTRSDYSGSPNTNLHVQFNGDTGNNYNGSAWFFPHTGAAGSTGGDGPGIDHIVVGRSASSDNPADTFASARYEIKRYGDTFFKRSLHGNGASLCADDSTVNEVGLFAGEWYNTSDPISGIRIFEQNDSNLLSGCRVTVWGIGEA